MEVMNIPIEKSSSNDLLEQWRAELELLKALEETNPRWDWKPVQMRLERLHALAHEIRAKKAQDGAKWQP